MQATHPAARSTRPHAGNATRSQRDTACDHEFIALLSAYRTTGGIYRGEALADQMELRGLGGYPRLARLIAAGELLSFEWRENYWLPAFQFKLDLSVDDSSRRIVRELAGAFDGWSGAIWLVTPNAWLGSGIPIERLKTDLGAVLDAARADRFATLG